jgi:hypothetical protein
LQACVPASGAVYVKKHSKLLKSGLFIPGKKPGVNFLLLAAPGSRKSSGQTTSREVAHQIYREVLAEVPKQAKARSDKAASKNQRGRVSVAAASFSRVCSEG